METEWVRMGKCGRCHPIDGQCKNFTMLRVTCCGMHWCADCCKNYAHGNCMPKWLPFKNAWVQVRKNVHEKTITVQTRTHVNVVFNCPDPEPVYGVHVGPGPGHAETSNYDPGDVFESPEFSEFLNLDQL